MNFNTVTKFENKICKFFNAPYGIAVDCCTHGIELCLRQQDVKSITVPKRTYLSVPMLANKLNIELKWKDDKWDEFYWIEDTNYSNRGYKGMKVIAHNVDPDKIFIDDDELN